jgi:hypothetical protein
MTLEAQGKPTCADDQMALQKRIQTFFVAEIKPDTTQTEILIGSLQFTSGLKKALEEFDLESVISKHKPSKQLAEKIRLGYKVWLQTAQITLDSLQNPQKCFAEIGQVIQSAAAEMNTIQKSA